MLYFAEIGLFVFGRWQQIADDHPDGAAIDEAVCDHRWDECTEKDLRAIKARIASTVNSELSRGRAAAFATQWTEKFDSVSKITIAIGWIFMEALRGFVGAIGILIFGLIFLHAAPSVTKAFRETIDDVAPRDTRPALEEPSKQLPGPLNSKKNPAD